MALAPWWLSCKESACNAGDLGLIPGLGRSPGEGKGYPLQYSGLENSMDCIVHGVAKSWTWLSDFHSLTSLKLSESSNRNPAVFQEDHASAEVSVNSHSDLHIWQMWRISGFITAQQSSSHMLPFSYPEQQYWCKGRRIMWLRKC